MARYIWLLLLAICCWHCMGRNIKDKAPARKDSSESKEGDAWTLHDKSGSKEDKSHEKSSSTEESSSREKGKGCYDRKKNQDETDIDCGGKKCVKCAVEKSCKENRDCISNSCKNKKCTQSAPELNVKTTTITRPTRTTTTTPESTTTTPEPTTTTPEPTTTTTEPTTTEPMTTESTTLEPTTTEPITAEPICEWECKNGGICTSDNQCTCADGFSGPTCEVQSVGLCLDDETFGTEPILLITFGNGSSQYSTETPASFNFNTTYKQRFAPVTNDGMFSFINSVNDDFENAWHTNAKDHSDDNNGYMYLVNAEYTPGQFYNGRVDNLCVGLRYEFSVYLANLCKPNGKINPNVLFEVRSLDGNELLAQLESGDVVEQETLTWQKYGFSFIAPESSVRLLMISNARGGNGNDLVIDDIALRVCANGGTGLCPAK